jgi:hypothetical protein
MLALEKVVPLNLNEEKSRFLSDQTYNPQFVYAESISPIELAFWGKPQEKLAKLASEFLKDSSFQMPKVVASRTITQSEIVEMITHFNEQYYPNPPVSVHFSEHQITQCRIKGSSLFFKLPITYTQYNIGGVIRHELETHFLRWYNHQKSNIPLPEETPLFRRTEEGLAILHTYLGSHAPMRKTFRTYLATWLAQQYSFSEVYRLLLEHGVNPKTALSATIRSKRGLTDTSQPGGLTKDICYLEGALLVWQWLVDPKHQPQALYQGRIALNQVSNSPDLKQIVTPLFMQDLAAYRQALLDIGKQNHYELFTKELHVTA